MQAMSGSKQSGMEVVLAAAGGPFQDEPERGEGVPVEEVSQIEKIDKRIQINLGLNAQIEDREADLISKIIKPFRSAIAVCSPETIPQVKDHIYDEAKGCFKEYFKKYTVREKVAYLYWKHAPASSDQGEEEPLCLWLANEITDTTKQFVGRKDGCHDSDGGLEDIFQYDIIKTQVSVEGAPLTTFNVEQKEKILGLNWEEILRKSVPIRFDD